MTKYTKRPNLAQQRRGRVLRSRRQEKRQGRGVEALEEAFANGELGLDTAGRQPQSNIIYYFIELRRPREERSAEGDAAGPPGTHWLQVSH